jgi:hypothetical protein
VNDAGFALFETLHDRPTMRPSLGALMARDFSGYGRSAVTVTLPVGNDVDRRRVLLGPIRGSDEAWMGGTEETTLPRWVSALINRCVTFKDGHVPDGFAEALTVADRDMIMVQLRMLTFGPELWAVTQCPHEGCRMRLDFTFPLTSLRVPQAVTKDKSTVCTVTCAGQKRSITYREPDGSDQEAIADIFHDNPYGAFLELLSRCILKFQGVPASPPVCKETLRAMPDDLLRAIDEAIAEGTTSFDWDIELSCPECARKFVTTLDIGAYFWEELALLQEDLFGEVHEMAFSYHWSEDAILGLPRWKRKLYLNHIHNERAGIRRSAMRRGYANG